MGKLFTNRFKKCKTPTLKRESKIELTGRSAKRRRRSALECSAFVKKKKKKNRDVFYVM